MYLDDPSYEKTKPIEVFFHKILQVPHFVGPWESDLFMNHSDCKAPVSSQSRKKLLNQEKGAFS